MHTLDPHAVHLRRLPFESHFRAGGGSKSPHRHSLLSPLSARQTDRTHGRSHILFIVFGFVAAGAVFRSIRGQCVLEDLERSVTFQRDKLRSIEIDTGEGWHYDIVLPAAPRRRFANSVRVCHAWDVCVFRMYLPYGGQSTAGIVQQDAPVRSQHGQP